MSSSLSSQPYYRQMGKWLFYLAGISLAAALGALATSTPKIVLGISVSLLLSAIILPKPRVGLFLIVALLPFEQLLPISEGLGIVKLVGIITFFAWLINLIRTKRTLINFRKRSTLYLISFLALATLSLTQANSLSIGLSRLITLLLLVFLYFLTIDLVQDAKTLRKILLTLIVSGAFAAL
ncbi:MAG: hypothetical protein KAX16_05935, partial [Actinomycetia bacterium]|nr:hypothetical protein [Actinomycetes bacterium]